MRIIFITLFNLFVIIIHSQQWTEVGLNLGMSFYNGDLNESRLFYQPALTYGILMKLNINNRYAVKFAAKNLKLRASDSDFENVYQNSRQNSFQSQVWDVVLQTEFNFLPYNQLLREKESLSPYITAGIGGGYLTNSGSVILVLPFGIGMKLRLNKRMGLASEWTFRKTFSDKVDNTYNITSSEKKSLIHNNDWYSIIGVIFTYNISKLRVECPAYE